MGEEKGNVLAYAMRGGLYLGGLFIVRDIVGMFIYSNVVSMAGAFAVSFLSLLSFVLTVFIVVKCTDIYKAEVLKEDVAYSRVLYYGFYLFFFASMLYAVFNFLCVTVIRPDCISEQKAFFDAIFTQMMAQSGLSAQMLSSYKEVFDTAIDDLMSQSPKELAMNSLFSETSYGFFFSLVSSIFLSRKNNSSLPGGGEKRI